MDNTLAASNYSQVVTESTPQGKQTDYLVFEAPDKLGGYVESGSKRTYVYVIGDTEYQSLTVPSNGLHQAPGLLPQPSQGAATIDPAHNYLRYASTAKNISQTGSTYSFTLTQNGETGHFAYTVSGQYISEFDRAVKTASVQLVISQVGTSPSGGVAERRQGGQGADQPHQPDRLAPDAVDVGSGVRLRAVDGVVDGLVDGPVDGPAEHRARASGSSASVSHRTTTKCRAPAATIPTTVVGSTPPVTHTGHGARSTASPT